MNEIIVQEQTIKDRLSKAFEVMAEEADINPMLMQMVGGFFENFLNTSDEDALRTMLVTLKDEYIPFILNGE